MAKIITLGCGVANIHQRYSEVHSSLFGASSYRLVISALFGKPERVYEKSEQTLYGLREELARLDEQIAYAKAEGDVVLLFTKQLPQTLVSYVHTLHEVMTQLQVTCHKLREDKDGYRNTDVKGQSQFNRDKIAYDNTRIKLEHLGSKLNRLFSSY